MTDISELETLRLDVWLWRARFIKTRSEASRLVKSGKVRLTRMGETKRVKKPHTTLRQGDVLAFMRGEQLIQVRMQSAGTRRGPAPEAQALYQVIAERSHEPKHAIIRN